MNFATWIPILISLFLAGFNAAIFVVIKFNDLAHLGKSLDEVKSSLKEITTKLDTNAVKIATIEGKCKANHG